MSKTKSNRSKSKSNKTKTKSNKSNMDMDMDISNNENVASNVESDMLEIISTNKLSSNKSKKSNKSSNNKSSYSPEKIIILCLEMLNAVKLYHWKTFKYSEHKATDELYGELNDKIDEFVETLIGKTGKRINLTKASSIKLANFNDINNFKKLIENGKRYLINMSNASPYSSNENSDLLNIRDEILGILNKFTYLLTLN